VSIDLSAPEIQAAIALADSQIDYELHSRKIPGISAGIVYDQALIWSKGYGFANLEQQIPADENSVYRCASITKLMTSTMLMLLRDAGKVNLDDPIEKYLPEFRLKSAFADQRPPTFRMVAAHAAGLPREGAEERWKTLKMKSAQELLEGLAASEIFMPTMTEPKYSNLGISMLGYALGKIAGQPYEEFVKAHIFAPLGMSSSGFRREAYTDAHYAQGYYKEGETYIPMRDWYPEGWVPAGGMYSTVADITKFMSLQFTDAPAGASPSQILGSSTLREMHMPVNVSADFNSGFGVGFAISRLNNYKLIGHGGSVPGYRTQILMVPALKLGVAVFTNTTTNPHAIAEKALGTLMPAFEHQLEEPLATPEQITAWKPYLGRYDWPTMDTVLDIRIHKNRLTALVVGEEPSTFVTLRPVGKHAFKMLGGHSANELLRFDVDASGAVTGLMFGPYPYRRMEDQS
jgi:CubicO group peptidase (beta-lactamase class C family)